MAARLIINQDPLQNGVTRQWGAGNHTVWSADGSVYMAWQDGLNARLIQRWPDGRQATIPLNPQPTMRPTLHAGPWGLYLTAGLDGDKTHLPYVFFIEEYQWPGAAPDPRVDQLIAQNEAQAQQIAALQTEVAELSTALGDIAGGAALTDEQAATLSVFQYSTASRRACNFRSGSAQTICRPHFSTLMRVERGSTGGHLGYLLVAANFSTLMRVERGSTWSPASTTATSANFSTLMRVERGSTPPPIIAR